MTVRLQEHAEDIRERPSLMKNYKNGMLDPWMQNGDQIYLTGVDAGVPMLEVRHRFSRFGVTDTVDASVPLPHEGLKEIDPTTQG